ncbi:MAG TPA: hypothetical protein VGL56_20840 [Fimbriimonadaceae bacterium]|jgi:hypothetical protein
MIFETFCEQHTDSCDDATTLRQGIADQGLSIFAHQQAEAIIGKPAKQLLEQLLSNSLVAEVRGVRHEPGCEHWQATTDREAPTICEGCGEALEEFVGETRYRWIGPLPPKTPQKKNPSVRQTFVIGDQITGDHATIIKANQGSHIVSQHNEGKQNHGAKPLWERITATACGVAFLAIILVIALFVPNPTGFQYTVFRIVLALSAGGFAGTFSGFLDVEFKNWLKAGGGLAVFVIVYFYVPAVVADKADASSGTATHTVRSTAH